MRITSLATIPCVIALISATLQSNAQAPPVRQRISIDDGWRFFRYTDTQTPDSLIYDQRPRVTDRNDNKVADTRAAESAVGTTSENVLKPWILPSANDFIKDPAKRHTRPVPQNGSATHPPATAPGSPAPAPDPLPP
ncbi:MAG TPA: hypothetical protein VGS79_05600, partial [Puia sp.]|nr:hypothetical protein [Puia sp.]